MKKSLFFIFLLFNNLKCIDRSSYCEKWSPYNNNAGGYSSGYLIDIEEYLRSLAEYPFDFYQGIGWPNELKLFKIEYDSFYAELQSRTRLGQYLLSEEMLTKKDKKDIPRIVAQIMNIPKNFPKFSNDITYLVFNLTDSIMQLQDQQDEILKKAVKNRLELKEIIDRLREDDYSFREYDLNNSLKLLKQIYFDEILGGINQVRWILRMFSSEFKKIFLDPSRFIQTKEDEPNKLDDFNNELFLWNFLADIVPSESAKSNPLEPNSSTKDIAVHILSKLGELTQQKIKPDELLPKATIRKWSDSAQTIWDLKVNAAINLLKELKEKNKLDQISLDEISKSLNKSLEQIDDNFTSISLSDLMNLFIAAEKTEEEALKFVLASKIIIIGIKSNYDNSKIFRLSAALLLLKSSGSNYNLTKNSPFINAFSFIENFNELNRSFDKYKESYAKTSDEDKLLKKIEELNLLFEKVFGFFTKSIKDFEDFKKFLENLGTNYPPFKEVVDIGTMFAKAKDSFSLNEINEIDKNEISQIISQISKIIDCFRQEINLINDKVDKSMNLTDLDNKSEELKKLSEKINSLPEKINSLLVFFNNAYNRAKLKGNSIVLDLINKITDEINQNSSEEEKIKQIIKSFSMAFCFDTDSQKIIIESILGDTFCDRRVDDNSNQIVETKYFSEKKINHPIIKIIAALFGLKFCDIKEENTLFSSYIDCIIENQSNTNLSKIDLSEIFGSPTPTAEDLEKLLVLLSVDSLNKEFREKIRNFIADNSIIIDPHYEKPRVVYINKIKEAKNYDQRLKKEDNTKKDGDNTNDTKTSESPKKTSKGIEFITKNLPSFIVYPINSIINLTESVFTSISLSFSQAYEFISSKVSEVKSGVKYLLDRVFNI